MSICKTAQKSLFWASNCVPVFEYVPWLACSKTISSICQSGWREIRNVFLVICWGRPQQENWRSFPDVNNQDYGRSSFNQNVGLEFSTTSSNEWNSISKNFQEEDVARYTQIFANTLPAVFFPFNFSPKISRIFSSMVCILEIQQFPEFWNLFREISVPFRFFQTFKSFGWMESTLYLGCRQCRNLFINKDTNKQNRDLNNNF